MRDEFSGRTRSFSTGQGRRWHKLPPFAVGSIGQLQEWQRDYDEPEPGHRHISHLWALFPGTQITLEHTPELAKAARASLERRLSSAADRPVGLARGW